MQTQRVLSTVVSLALLALVHAGLLAQQRTPAETELQLKIQKAESLRKQNKVDEAITEYREAITQAGRAYGSPGDLRTVPLLQRLAGLYMVREKYGEAEFLYKRAVDVRKSKLPGDHSDLAESLDALGDFYRRRAQFDQAEPLYQKSLAIHQARKEVVPIARSLGRLAGLRMPRGDFAQAETLARRSVELLEKDRQANALELARALNNLAAVYKARGDHARAKELLEDALRLRQDKGREDLVAQTLNNLGELAHLTGLYDAADAHYQRALAIQKAQLGAGHPELAQTLGNLGLLALARGDLTAAEPLLERSLKVLRDQLGPEHSEVAQGLNNLALLRRAVGQYDQAEELFKESLRIRTARLGGEHLEVAGSLNNLANLHFARSRLQEAEPFYRECLRIQTAHLGQEHPGVAKTVSNLGVLATALGRHDEADRLLHRALRIRQARLGEAHPETAQSLNDLAVLARARGLHDEAEKLYRQSLRLFEAALPPDHPQRALTLANLGMLLAATERWQESADVADTARRSVRRHVQSVLPGLAEQEQLQFLETHYEPAFHTALSLGLTRRQDEALAALSAGWALNGKAVGQQALAERALLARDSQDPAAALLARQLATVRAQLATFSLQNPAAGQELAHGRLLAGLAAQERRLAKQLGRTRQQREQADPWVELTEVRRVLPRDTVLIEMVRLRPREFKAAGTTPVWQAERYVAWIIPAANQGVVRLLDLGPATKIDAAVQAVRQEVQDALRTIGVNEAASERRLRRVLADAAVLVLRPLEAQAGPARRWLLCPDGALWLLPWAALPLADGSFALEKHAISYQVSGRDLLVDASKEQPGPALILADPDYDRQSAGVATTRGAGLLRLAAPAKRLPGTAVEARAIAPRLKAYTGANPQVFLGKDALEEKFKKTHSPRVVQLATHGFFLDDASAGASRNPLLRCGLLLAGCNQPGRPGADDGILTGLEIVGADLRGTELVVLSACETALGQVRSGEGVAGLRQAFQLAGARSVVATLWQIPDRETVPLMTAFFDGLARGESKADALRDAQLKLLESGRAGNGSTHPCLWAAFTVTGE